MHNRENFSLDVVNFFHVKGISIVEGPIESLAPDPERKPDMFTASLIDDDYHVVEIESYETLDAAIAEMVRMGWEETADRLLSSPVLIRDDDNHVVAVISYTPDPDEPDYPLLCVHFTRTDKLSLFRWHQTADGYEGRLASESYIAK